MQQQLALARRAALQARKPLSLAERLLKQRGAHEGRHQAHRLQPELELAVAAGDAGDRLLDHGERLQGVLAPGTAGPHQRERRLRPLFLIERGVGRCQHVVERLGAAEPVFGPGELEQQR